MSSEVVLKVEGIGKRYEIYEVPHHRLLQTFLRGRKQFYKEFWALRGVSFEVKRGETLGIIGRNGSGKSTLLQIIAGTLAPTTGKVSVAGKVAALLELGSGFNPDFTGRENVYMNGAVMGFSREEMDKKFDAITAFTDIGAYMDQPVRVYSSGMQMRLAFSVATAHRPQVLIVDEALAVGDTYFQHKSFNRIRQFSKQGTTLLIVSHDAGAIKAICDRALLLDAGQIAMKGEPEAVLDYYNARLAGHQNQSVKQVVQDNGKMQTVSGTGEATIEEISLLDEKGTRVELVNVGQSLRLRIVARAAVDFPELVLGYMIKDRLGQPVFGTNTYHLKCKMERLKKNEIRVFCFDFAANLGEGSYSMAVALHTSDTHILKNYEWRDLALVFKVINIDKNKFEGVAWLPPRLE